MAAGAKHCGVPGITQGRWTGLSIRSELAVGVQPKKLASHLEIQAGTLLKRLGRWTMVFVALATDMVAARLATLWEPPKLIASVARIQMMRTGRSAEVFSSVSVAAASATQADALATAVFVLGLEKGPELVRSTPSADALLVLKDGRTLAATTFPAAI